MRGWLFRYERVYPQRARTAVGRPAVERKKYQAAPPANSHSATRIAPYRQRVLRVALSLTTDAVSLRFSASSVTGICGACKSADPKASAGGAGSATGAGSGICTDSGIGNGSGTRASTSIGATIRYPRRGTLAM